MTQEVVPRIAVRDGVALHYLPAARDRDEADAAARFAADAHAAGLAWRDVLVVAPGKRKWRERLAVALDALQVPHRMLLGEPGALPDAAADVVHVASLYGAEGLACPAVCVVGLGDLPWKQQPLDEAVRIVAAAAAVATQRVMLSSSKSSALVAEIGAGDPTSP